MTNLNTFLQEILTTHPTIKNIGVEIAMHLMKAHKKNNYYGTSVKRYTRVSDSTNHTIETYGATGDIYINLRDIESTDKLLRVVADEASHITIDTDEFKRELYQYLKKYEDEIRQLFEVKVKKAP